ncbi:uncharacterized protein LOC143446947 isoform X3 [Clavelina lepadiformis]|uniref:uncharacterized protein LOC143446947 isoform X3 n=1 Tax=Clavelina lepadiformis TaxID=159417 RepID=UPI0040426C81
MEFAFRSILSLLLFLTPLQDCLADSGSYDDELTFIDAEGVRASLLPRDGSSCSLGYCHSGHVCQYRWGFPYCDTYSAKVGATCDDNPCEHGGTCQPDGVNNYRCDCPADVYGYSCQTGSTLCASVSCNNGGTCITVSGGGARCHCADNFTGTMCEISCSLSCLNGGNCERTSQGQMCVCLPGYYGMLCENGVCSPNPCLNGATCEYTTQGFDVVSNYRCNCPPGFTGSTCAVRLNACALSPCLNGGTCVENFPNSYRCSCPPLYFGSNCELLCSLPCQNGGSCTVLGGLPTCACPAGYSGTYCTVITACEQAPCLNGGTCNPDASYPYGYNCSCLPQFGGNNCDQTCTVSCQNGGSCQFDRNGFQACICPTGYTGYFCDESPCDQYPCLNGGTCFVDPTQSQGFRCNCANGFTGSTCGDKIFCNLPCFNGGSCQIDPRGDTCVCLPGYVGLNCEDNVCSPNPCFNGGSCAVFSQSGFEMQSTYMCSCPKPYFGANCELLCSLPCQNGGSCTVLGGLPTCACPAGYSGTYCTVIPACEQAPCLNGGTCNPDASYPDGYNCSCLPQFGGNNCDQTCTVSCQNGGSCQFDRNGFQACVCPTGYTGYFCDESPCDQYPCLNGGTCFVDPTRSQGYRCNCANGFTGSTCGDKIFCNLPCFNGGSCQIDPRGDTCVCLPGYVGLNCEDNVCSPNPCLNGGSCAVSQSGFEMQSTYMCSCPKPYFGANCELFCSLPCQNGGSCTVLGGLPTCACPPGYSGTYCTVITACEQAPCLNAGTCNPDASYPYGYNCSCLPQFGGNNCDQTCTVSCQNGGSCQFDRNGFQACVCPTGYTGYFCDESLCDQYPCVNGGTCVVDPTQSQGFRCNCANGFTGSTCGDKTFCNLPCFNGGSCQIEPRGDTCVCLPGYVGLNCEDNVCSPNPCLNGGICAVVSQTGFEMQSTYMCSCPKPYFGANCELLCSLPCQNGGSCTVLSGLPTCACPPGYSGTYCTVITACEQAPCLNGGTCNPDASYPYGYNCSCLPQFDGNNCDQTCTVSCQNGGSCQFDRNGFQACICPTGYTGYFCDESPCDQYPCVNRGTCVVDPTQSQGFRCSCPRYFTGPLCQNMPTCSSSPCLNGGICVDDPSSDVGVTCLCSKDFTGKFCERDTRVYEGACSSNPCLGPNCQCLESCKHEHGYYCMSQQGYIGQNCDIGPPSLTCHHDKIELEVSAGFYNEYDDTKTSFMYFSSTVDGYKSVQACQAQPINGKYRITILSPFTTSCGTTRTQALNSHTYNNTLWINRRTGSFLYDMPFPVLDWSCTFNYDLDVVASLQPVIDVQRSNISGGHQYTASVSLCKVSSCQRSCPPSLVVGAGAIYTVSETIHLSINFKATHLFPTSSFTDVARAFLSCSQDPSWSGEIVPLSDTGCDLNSPLDVRAGSSSSQHAACMSFKVPRFHQCTTIYIHLRLRICSSSDVTTSFCSNGDRVQHCPSRITKRSTRDDDITYHVIGPITIVDKGVDTIEFVSESGTSVVVENVSILELQESYQASHPGAINTPFLATIITLFISIVLLLFISILCVCHIGKRSKFI